MNNNEQKVRDVIVLGGGLAGLSLANILTRNGVDVQVIEKGDYPRNKVCGEYISRESEDFLKKLGLSLNEMNLPHIDEFQLSFPNGKKHRCQLKPGGIGLSRLTLDYRLYQLLKEMSCDVQLNTKITSVDVETGNGYSLVHSADGDTFAGRLVVGATGRSGHSIFHTPSEKQKKSKKYFGLKYHIHSDQPEHLIQIHLFSGGYAGISKVENGKYCLCYLADARHLKKYKGSVENFERAVMYKNPHLKKIFTDLKIIEGPVTTARFQFDYFDTVKGDTFLMGDSAGFIPPLTGNGMSLAFRSASVLGNLLTNHFNGKTSLKSVKEDYRNFGNIYLKKRIRSGLFLQELALNSGPVGKQMISGSMSLFPILLKRLSQQASGKKF